VKVRERGARRSGRARTKGGFMVSRGRAFGAGVVSACLGRCRPLPILLVISLGLVGEEGSGCGESLMVGSKRECRLRRGLR
jgi:hypothetical protein